MVLWLRIYLYILIYFSFTVLPLIQYSDKNIFQLKEKFRQPHTHTHTSLSELILHLNTPQLMLNFGIDLFIRLAYSYSSTIPDMVE